MYNVILLSDHSTPQVIQFLSDLGGAVGLYLGASIITVVELLDLSCQCCRFQRRKRKYKARKAIQAKKDVANGTLPSSSNNKNSGRKLPRVEYGNKRHHYN